MARMRGSGVRVLALPPAEGLRGTGARRRPTASPRGRRRGRPDGGVGIAEEWTATRRNPITGATRTCACAARSCRAVRRVAENWLEATGGVLSGRRLDAELESCRGGGPMQVVRSSAGVGDANVEAPLPRDRRRARVARSLRPPPASCTPSVSEAPLKDTARSRRPRPRAGTRRGASTRGWVHIASHTATTSCSEGRSRASRGPGPTMLRAKILVLNGISASVGSVAWSNRSLPSSTMKRRCTSVTKLNAPTKPRGFEQTWPSQERIEPQR